MVGGLGASRALRGRSAEVRLGFFSSPVADVVWGDPSFSFLLPTAIRFAFGGVGGIKLGGLSLRPDIRPSEINFRRFENSSGSPFGFSAGYIKSLTSSIAAADFDFVRGFDEKEVVVAFFSARLSGPGPTSILCTKGFGESAEAPSGGTLSPFGV